MWRHVCNWENTLTLVLYELRIYTFAIQIVAIPSDCFHGDRYYLHVFACVPSATLLMFLQWLELFQYWRIVCLTTVPVYSWSDTRYVNTETAPVTVETSTEYQKAHKQKHVSSIYLHESNLMESQQFLLRTYKYVIHIILAWVYLMFMGPCIIFIVE